LPVHLLLLSCDLAAIASAAIVAFGFKWFTEAHGHICCGKIQKKFLAGAFG